MSFLLPQMLWALPAVSLPLLIHLLSRANTKVVDFSSLRFLTLIEHNSMRRLNWNQWLLVLIRSLLLLFFILLLARPVVRGYFRGFLEGSATTLTVCLVDDSFSMSGITGSDNDRGRGALAQTQACLKPLLAHFKGNQASSRAVLMRMSDARIIFDGDVADLPRVEEIASLCNAGFARDNLARAMDSLSTEAFKSTAGLFANKELIILSDFQAHQRPVLQSMARDTAWWNDWHFFFLTTPNVGKNAAVTGADIRSTIPLVGELMTVAVTIENTGQQSLRKLPVQVVLNGVRSGQLVVDLQPGEQRTVEFQVAPTEPGHQQGYAEIERDDRIGDNRFYFHTYIPPSVSVLLIEEDPRSNSFTQAALAALTRSSPQIKLRQISPGDLSWQAQDYQFIIVNELTEAPRLLPRRLREYLQGGGNLVLIPGPDKRAGNAFNSMARQLTSPVLNTAPARNGEGRPIDSRSIGRSVLNQVFSSERALGDLPLVSQFYRTQARGTDDVLLRITGKNPLLVRTPIGDGSVFTFTLPFNLLWTDMPLRGSFIPLWHRLIHWQQALDELLDVRVGDTPVLQVTARQATQPLTMRGPQNVSSLIIPDIRTRSVTLRDLSEPGVYALTQSDSRSQAGVGRPLTRFRVNISEEELSNRLLSRSSLTAAFEQGHAFMAAEGSSIEEWIQQARFGQELWRPLLYLVIICLILELVIGNAYNSPRKQA